MASRPFQNRLLNSFSCLPPPRLTRTRDQHCNTPVCRSLATIASTSVWQVRLETFRSCSAGCLRVCLSVCLVLSCLSEVSAIWPHRSRVRRTELGLPLRSADKLRVGPTATPPPAPSHFAAKQPTTAQTTSCSSACICVAVRSSPALAFASRQIDVRHGVLAQSPFFHFPCGPFFRRSPVCEAPEERHPPTSLPSSIRPQSHLASAL